MRASGWLLPIAALLLWIACIGYPAVAVIGRIAQLPRTDVEIRSAGTLLATSLGWAAAVAVGAVCVGWAPGRVLGRGLSGRGFLPLATLLLVPICLPAYVVFFAWWQSWPADTAIYRWVVDHHQMQLARHVTLYLGLVCWSWPLVAWCVAGSVAATPAQREELLRLDGAGWVTRLIDHLRCDGRGLLIGALLVFLATLSNTTCFDLSEVFTFTNELRAVEALGANARDVLVAGLPAMLLCALGALAAWLLLAGRPSQSAERVSPVHASTKVAAAIIWIISVIAPLGLFARNVIQNEHGRRIANEFFSLYSHSVVNTLLLALISGLAGAVIALGLTAAWQDHRRGVRMTAGVMAISWLIAAVMPGMITGIALKAAYDRATFLDPLYIRLVHPPENRGMLQDLVSVQPTILVLGHMASFGFVAALMARWAAMREARQLGDLRRLDGAQTLRGMIESSWPRLLAAAVAALAIIFVLALGEIPVTAMLNPPTRAGHGPLALTLLNDMHYQRPQTVMIAALGLIAAALLASLLVAGAWLVLRRSGRLPKASAMAMLSVLILLPALAGCAHDDDPDNAPALKPELVFGVAGNSLGQFGYPRALDVDPLRKFIYVIDKTARVQRFGFDGRPQLQWHMPEMANGKPTGVSVAPDGRVFVPDTHYFRVIAYDADGTELLRFGGYGTEPGQFIYTTDVAFGPEGRLYVSEYGGNDRVQVFDPKGNYLFQFGSFGPDEGQFNRPQSMVFNPQKTELFIADACNHRIDVFDPQGKFLHSFGTAGHGAGQLAYPYGLAMLDDGSLLVAEFGNNRIQRLDQHGKCLGLMGRVGRGTGELQYPWAVAGTQDQVFVLDSGNNRVQVIRSP